MAVAVKFQLLGPLEVRVDDRPIRLGGGRQRALLTVLLLEANHVVPVDRLVDAVCYPSLRYGIDGTLVWPRLYQVLPERILFTLAGARSDLDAMLALSTLSGFFAVSSAAYLLASTASWSLYLLCFWAGAAFSWLAYRAALVGAVTCSQQVRVAFDLYRAALLEHLGEATTAGQ